VVASSVSAMTTDGAGTTTGVVAPEVAPVVAPVAALVQVSAGALVDGVIVLTAAVDDLLGVPLWQAPDAGIRDAVVELERQAARLEAVRLRVLAAADERRVGTVAAPRRPRTGSSGRRRPAPSTPAAAWTWPSPSSPAWRRQVRRWPRDG